jgi:hypothetical protein
MGRASAVTQAEFNVPEGTSQMYHVEGLPFGTRGGLLSQARVSRLTAKYIFKIVPVNEGNMGQANRPFGAVPNEKLEITIDGERVHLFDWDKDMVGFAVRFGVPTPPIRVKGRLHAVGVTFSRPPSLRTTTASTSHSCGPRSKRAAFPDTCSSARRQGPARRSVQCRGFQRYTQPPKDSDLPADRGEGRKSRVPARCCPALARRGLPPSGGRQRMWER